MQPLLSSRRLDVLHRILSTPISSNLSLVAIRDRSRQVGELFGLDNLQRTRFITAISEIARNAGQFAGGGTLTFLVGDATGRSTSNVWPRRSSFDVAVRLRKRFCSDPLTLIALSGYATEEFHKQAIDAGFDYYFAKPMPIEKLFDTLESLPGQV
jgi:hypothetical protein